MNSKNQHNIIYAPHSIYHGMEIHSTNGRLPFSNETLLRIELSRLTDFVEFLFEHSEHCDHITHREAYKEFLRYENKCVRKNKRKEKLQNK